MRACQLVLRPAQLFAPALCAELWITDAAVDLLQRLIATFPYVLEVRLTITLQPTGCHGTHLFFPPVRVFYRNDACVQVAEAAGMAFPYPSTALVEPPPPPAKTTMKDLATRPIDTLSPGQRKRLERFQARIGMGPGTTPGKGMPVRCSGLID